MRKAVTFNRSGALQMEYITTITRGYLLQPASYRRIYQPLPVVNMHRNNKSLTHKVSYEITFADETKRRPAAFMFVSSHIKKN